MRLSAAVFTGVAGTDQRSSMTSIKRNLLPVKRFILLTNRGIRFV